MRAAALLQGRCRRGPRPCFAGAPALAPRPPRRPPPPRGAPGAARAAPRPPRSAAGAAARPAPPPAACASLPALSALVAAEARRQGPGWHAAALSQLARLAGAGGARGGRAAAELAQRLAASLNKAATRGSGDSGDSSGARHLSDLGVATAALARLQALAPGTRPELQAALRRLEAAAIEAAAGLEAGAALGSGSDQGSGGDGGAVLWEPGCVTAAARGLAAAAYAGEAPDPAAVEAVVRACRAAAAGPGSVEVRPPCAPAARTFACMALGG
jgi:hypothetical protein